MIQFEPYTKSGQLIFEIETLKKAVAETIINDIRTNQQLTADAVYAILPYVSQVISKEDALKQCDIHGL
jgi:hypothetical protein